VLSIVLHIYENNMSFIVDAFVSRWQQLDLDNQSAHQLGTSLMRATP
jgi:hypothetical protein